MRDYNAVTIAPRTLNVKRTSRIYSLNNFLLYNAVPSTIIMVTMLYIRTSLLYNWKFVSFGHFHLFISFSHILSFPHPLTNTNLFSVSMKLGVLDYRHKWDHAAFVFLHLTLVTTWMDLDRVMLSEISQMEKDKCCMISFMSVI